MLILIRSWGSGGHRSPQKPVDFLTPHQYCKAPLERRGSSCSADCTKNQPGRPILRPCRGAKQIRPECLQVPRLGRPHGMVNQAPGFWRIFGPLGPTAGPGNIGTGSRSRHTMQAMLHEASSTLHASCDRPRNPPGPAEEEHPLQTGHDAIGKEKQTGGRRQGTEKDLGPKSKLHVSVSGPNNSNSNL